MGCRNCGKDLVQIPGKRAKTFCSVTCRSNYWQKKKRESAQKKIGTPGRPKKEDHEIQNTELILPGNLGSVNVGNGVSEIKKVFKDKKGTTTITLGPIRESFMGHSIPKGLKGIELSIWKAEIKDKNK